MLLATGLVLIGMVLLVGGGDVLLRGAVSLATRLKLTPAVIGLTVVAFGTSVPELAVSVLAAVQGKPDICVGNVVGSNISNVTLVLGCCALFGLVRVSGAVMRREYPMLLAVSLLYLVFGFDGLLERWEGGLFLGLYVLLTGYMVWRVRRETTVEAQIAEETVDTVEEVVGKPEPRILPSLLLVVLGIALLAGGAQVTVIGAVSMAQLLGVPEYFVSLTVLAVGTSLPEIVTSIVATLRGRDDVALGNVIGSNISNLLVILGLSSLVVPLPLPYETILRDNWWMLATTLLLLPMMMVRRQIGWPKALLLLAVYAGYIGHLVLVGAVPPAPNG